MANLGPEKPNTNSSQFFFTVFQAKHLDGKHVCFGRVTLNMLVCKSSHRVEATLAQEFLDDRRFPGDGYREYQVTDVDGGVHHTLGSGRGVVRAKLSVPLK